MMIGTMDILIGFLILLVVIFIETIYLSRSLSNKWVKPRIFYTVLLSNLLSTVLGLLGLVSWLWDHIVDQVKNIFGYPGDFTSNYFLIGFILFAFIMTLLCEIPFNLLLLGRAYAKRNVIIYSMNANLLTYLLLGILVFSIN
jgi:hypothetical protein